MNVAEVALIIVVPFISHVEKKITQEQAIQIAGILGLPAELSFISLTIDESLNLKAFARGVSNDHPFHYNSVPFNWLSYEAPPPPQTPAPIVVEPPAPMPSSLDAAESAEDSLLSIIMGEES